MKTNFRFFIVFFSLVLTLSVQAQVSDNLEISKNKILVAGKVYLLHVVKKGQTLYSISKAYRVSQQQIINDNPEVAYGVQEGQALRIAESEQKDAFEVDKGSPSVDIHIVKPGETLYSIARQYNIKVENIQEVNPSLTGASLKTGEKIKIPKMVPVVQKQVAKTTDFTEHEVQPKETLFSLAKQYNTTVDDLVAMNDSSLTSGLKTGQVIRVPKSSEVAKPVKEKAKADKDSSRRTIVPAETRSETLNCTKLERKHSQSSYNVAVMLPFFSQVSERKSAVDNNEEPVSSNFLEFYEGILMASSMLKDSGISINIYTYDTERNTDRVVSMLKRPEMENMDLIIGPLLPENIRLASDFARKKHIPLISPLSARDEFVTNNPWVFQLNPSANVVNSQLAKYLTRGGKRNIIIFHSSDKRDIEQSEQIRRSVKALSPSTAVRVVSTSQTLASSLSGSLENVVILASENEIFVTSNLRKMVELSRNHHITVMGDIAWMKMKNLSPEIMYKLEVEFCSPYYTNFSTPEAKEIVQRFKYFYGYEPYNKSSHGFVYGIYGFDIAMQFIKALDRYGKNMGCCINEVKASPVVSDFYFSCENGSGYVNQAVSIIKYNSDNTVTRKMLILK
jgi:LysM repeat protein/ABC-type branched-subunit amino acid transport system substrate-binding protein